ncbi:MAG: AbrB/MazE/SpoVT family DNA-binding domain-containing protein [Anaerolineae bacterium]|nr:AbrB/MazE/SpoVT family DNA-binding domain-containing protein [Anaerolineae bacterium]
MESTVTSKGQIVIPAAIRRKLGIKAGTKVYVFEENERVVVQPVTREYIHKVRGSLKGAGALKTLEQERDRERDG